MSRITFDGDRSSIHRPIFMSGDELDDNGRMWVSLHWGDHYGDPVWMIDVIVGGRIARWLDRRAQRRWQRRLTTQPQVGTCRHCGCTDDHACPGGCWWAPDHPDGGALCSTCARELGLPIAGGLKVTFGDEFDGDLR